MKTKAELLIETLTKDSGRVSFTTKETTQLQEISYFEGRSSTYILEDLINEFKKSFVLEDDEWLC